MLHDMTARGLRAPSLVIIDGNPGLRKTVRKVLPDVRVQWCQVHKMRNIFCKVSKLMQPELRRLVREVFLAQEYATGLCRGRALIVRFWNRYPEAMRCLEKHLEECLTYPRFLVERHKRIRTSNLIVSYAGLRHLADGLAHVAQGDNDAQDPPVTRSTEEHTERENAGCARFRLTDVEQCLPPFTGKLRPDPCFMFFILTSRCDCAGSRSISC